MLQEAGLPSPVPQYEVVLPHGGRSILDFAYVAEWVAIEADSYRYHSSLRDWSRDRTRNAVLTALGWRIIPVTWDDLGSRAGHVVALVDRSLHDFRR